LTISLVKLRSRHPQTWHIEGVGGCKEGSYKRPQLRQPEMIGHFTTYIPHAYDYRLVYGNAVDPTIDIGILEFGLATKLNFKMFAPVMSIVKRLVTTTSVISLVDMQPNTLHNEGGGGD